jgi:hypothetical protein
VNDHVRDTPITPAQHGEGEQPPEQREADAAANDDATMQVPIVAPDVAVIPENASPGVAATGTAAEPMPRFVSLVELGGHDDGRVTPITDEIAVIGRRQDDLTLALPHDLWVSRRHAQLTYRDGVWWIKDLGSSNGTWLDTANRLVRGEEALTLGAVFRVGHTDLMLTDDPDAPMS